MLPKLRPYEPSYYLLEESRKSWDHVVSDKLVYFLKPRKVASDSLTQIAKHYLEGRFWIESHLTLRGYQEYSLRFDDASVKEQIETPKKVTLNGCGIPSMIRLKRFDDTHCICGYSSRLPLKAFPGVLIGSDVLVKNRELGPLGIRNRQLRKRPDQVVQCCASAGQKITGDKGDSRRDLSNLEVNQVSAIFYVMFGPDGMGLRFAKSAKFIPQVIKVFLRPTGFEFGISYGGGFIYMSPLPLKTLGLPEYRRLSPRQHFARLALAVELPQWRCRGPAADTRAPGINGELYI